MAVQISTNVEFIQANTTTNAGFILLPSTTTLAGRLLTIKDTAGTFGLRPLTLSTIGNDRFEEGTNLKRLVEPFGYITLASDGVNRWYIIDGTSMNTYTISTLTNPISISTQSVFTSSVTVSTLGFEDRAFNTVSSFYTRSTLLYLGSNIIGGSKCGPTLFIPTRRPFQPNQISGSILWLDAADPNVFTGGSIWYDKSGTRNNGIGTQVAGNSMPTVGLWPNGLQAATFTRVGNTTGTSMMTTSSTNPANTYTLYMVMRLTGLAPTSDPNGTEQFFFINNVEGARQVKTITSATAGFPANIVFYFDNTVGQFTLTTSVEQNQGFLLGYVPALPSGTIYFNSGTTNTQTTATSAISRWYFGSANASANRYLTGQIGEILAYNSVLSQSNREQVEGYLAWKWGVVGNLPATHPYKTAPP